MLINTFFELLSLGAFIPILMIFFDPNILNNQFLISFFPSSLIVNKSNLLIFFVACLSGIYLTKSIFQIYFNYFKFNLYHPYKLILSMICIKNIFSKITYL